MDTSALSELVDLARDLYDHLHQLIKLFNMMKSLWEIGTKVYAWLSTLLNAATQTIEAEFIPSSHRLFPATVTAAQ